MKLERASGILLHPSSLPGGMGIGDLGGEARRFVDFLQASGCGWWQLLPLGPTGFDNSPYQSFSAFAGNPYLISPEILRERGWLPEMAPAPGAREGSVDFSTLIPWKSALLDAAFERFRSVAAPADRRELEEFRAREQSWLDDLSLFMALKEAQQGARWDEWPNEVRHREPAALERSRSRLGGSVEKHAFRQFVFFQQWEALKGYAAEHGVGIFGDVPIFVASDSADVWAHPDLFLLDESGTPSAISGVPPDYFSKTGQLWGNPLYRWEAHAAQDFAWWKARLRSTLRLADLARLDHFRGFAAAWEIPAGSPTAQNGSWVPGPGAALFERIQEELGDLPFVAEDLGVITADVEALRDRFSLPGMRVLQFAFTDPENPFLPHAYPCHCVVYTGTHDNDTTRGWFGTAGKDEKSFCRRYLGRDGSDIAWDLIRAAWASCAVLALAPMQDILDLDSGSRMNLPGRPSGSWSWRMQPGSLSPALAERLGEMNYVYQRSRAAATPSRVAPAS
ncbi:MAG TPA: 4-alpha-glucanotransferase [Candidatus Polarisedimenticolia bacterium]|nr:4-alpha-glucanotransferase [Candidatus Polarisedimenticolia bacterium]